MSALVVADKISEWRKLKALVLDSVSSPITRRVYNLGLDEFISWYSSEFRPAGFTNRILKKDVFRRIGIPCQCFDAYGESD